mgnify:FL=1|jgi:hypothetical protein
MSLLKIRINKTENITVETINKNKYKKEEVQNMDGFMKFKKALQKHFDEMQKEEDNDKR